MLAPVAFEMTELKPEMPIVHTDRQLLDSLIAQGVLDAQIASLIEPPYVQFADGRVVYYIPVDKIMGTKVIPGSKYDRKQKGLVEVEEDAEDQDASSEEGERAAGE